MKTGRRSFLKGVGGATAAAFTVREKGAEAALAVRPVSASRQVLELEREIVGALQSAEGGGASAIVNGSLDSGFVVRKDVAGITYDDITMALGVGMAPAFLEWLRAFFDRDFRRRSGAVIAADFSYKERARREFHEALITEVSFPALDASKKEPAYMEVKIQPERTHYEPGSGGKVQPPDTSKAKSWLVSNFEVQIPGLESATKRVSKVDAFMLRMKTLEEEGETPPFESQRYLEVGNLVLTIPSEDAQPFLDWFEDFVIQGRSGPDDEKAGAIVFLSPNAREELFRIELVQVGIVSVGEAKLEANSDQVRRTRVELYVEEVKLQVKGSGG